MIERTYKECKEDEEERYNIKKSESKAQFSDFRAKILSASE